MSRMKKWNLTAAVLRPYNHAEFSSHVEVERRRLKTTHQDRQKTYNGQINGNGDAHEPDTETIASDMMWTQNERGFAQFKARLVMNELSQTLGRGKRISQMMY